jgi:hypothetical protein
MRAALAVAREMSLDRNSIVAVGLGHKHSRKSCYGTRPRISLKFFVRFKRRQPAAEERVPARIYVVHRGVRYAVPTDVVAVGRIGHHLILSPPLEVGIPQAPMGSCGFLATDNAGNQYLATAGHLLRNAADGTPVLVGTSVDDAGLVGGARVGVVCGLPYPTNSDGQIQDVGLVRIDAGVVVPGLNPFPWRSIKGVVGEDDLFALYNKSLISCQAFGLIDSPSCVVDSILPYGKSFPDLGCYYAATLVCIRALDGVFSSGDSGAPVVMSSGQLVGIHVVGSDPGTPIGFSVLAASALDVLSKQVPSLTLIKSA